MPGFAPTLDAGIDTPSQPTAGQALQNAYKNMNPATATQSTSQKLNSALNTPKAPVASQPSTNGSEVSSAPPLYNGGHINSIPHVANALGAQYTHNPADGTYSINGQTVKPTSIVNGIGHAPVSTVAQVAGVHPTAIQQSGNTTTITAPANSANGTTQQQSGQLNPYWQDVYNHGGLWMSPTNGETPQQFKQEVAQHYGVDPNQMMMQSNGHVWIPFNAIQNWAYAQTQPQQQQQAPQAPNYADLLAQLGQGFMTQVNGSAPQAPQLPQIPTFDTSSLTPFQFDMQGDATNAYNALDPTYQDMINTDDAKMMAQQNARGTFNSGIGQQAVNQQNATIRGKEWNAINQQVFKDRTQQYNEWKQGVTNQLNAYKANVDALYKNGQLSNQQYAQALNEWKTQVGAAQNAFDQQAKQLLASQSQDASMQQKLLPYTMGPTPYQQDQLSLQMYKAQLPYTTMTQYQQADMALKTRTEQFNEIVKAQQLGQAQQKINLASQSESFKEWLGKNNYDMAYQKMTDAEKSKEIDQWMKQEQINLNQDNQVFTNTRNQIDNLTKMYDSTSDPATKQNLLGQINKLTDTLTQASKSNYVPPLGSYQSK